jgi:hypothetical protein
MRNKFASTSYFHFLIDVSIGNEQREVKESKDGTAAQTADINPWHKAAWEIIFTAPMAVHIIIM